MNVYIYTHMYTYAHIYIYFYIFVYVQILTKAQICTVLCASCLSNQVTWSLKIPLGVSRNPSRATSALVAGLMSGNAFRRALVPTECEEKRWSHSGKGRSEASESRGRWYRVCFSRVSLPPAESSHVLVSSLQEGLNWSGLQWGGRFGNLSIPQNALPEGSLPVPLGSRVAQLLSVLTHWDWLVEGKHL